MVGPQDKTTHDGKTVSWLTHVVLMRMEKRLGYPLTVVQGSFHKGVGASKGTHDKSGVVDLAAWDWRNKVAAGRAEGMAIWHRPAIPHLWGEHIHGAVIGDPDLAPLARSQVTDYFNGRNGLKGHALDPFPRPNPIPTPKWPGSDAALALEAEMQALYKQWSKKPAPSVSKKKVPAKTHLVDLSHWNTVTKAGLQTAIDSGVRSVYHKATEGTGVTDATYSTRRGFVTPMKAYWGGYHFARLGASDGPTQARFFLSVAKPKPGDMVPMLDLETVGIPSGWSRARITKWVGAWVATVEKAIGLKPVIYLSQGIDLDDTFGCKLWVPRYSDAMLAPKVNAPWKTWTIWQYGQEQYGIPESVPGLGRVDRNTINPALTASPMAVIDSLRIPLAVVKKPSPPKKPGSSTVELSRVRHGQVNVQQTDPKAEVEALMRSMTDHFDVIVWNELGTLQLQNYARDIPGWDTWVPGGERDDYSMPGQVSISWNKDVWQPAAPGTSLTFVKAVQGVTPTRVVNSILLKNVKTKRQFYAVGGHAPHHIEEDGKWRVHDQIKGQNTRAKMYFAGLNSVMRDLAKTKIPVIGSADMNWDWFATKHLPPSERQADSPFVSLGKVAHIVPPTDGTHGSRAIDWVWTVGEATVIRDVVLPRASSDHNPRFTAIDI